MGDLLSAAYPWIKALHIAAVISWMAGIFYLPRLYVYHAEKARTGSELSETLKIMEVRLLRVIMNPAMIVTWVAGLALLANTGHRRLVGRLDLGEDRDDPGHDLVSPFAVAVAEGL